jgi:DNA mismatch repair protein MutS2
VETENSKRTKKTTQEVKAQRVKKAQVAEEVQKEVKVIRQKKKVEKKKAVIAEKNKPLPVFKIGDRVRMQDGKAVGSIDKLEKNKAVVNYGMFTTNVSVDQLELVEAIK